MVTSSRHAAPASAPPSRGRAGPRGGAGSSDRDPKADCPRHPPASRRSRPGPPSRWTSGAAGSKRPSSTAPGRWRHDRVRIPTPYPLSPQKLVTVLEDLIKPLPPFDRVSVGFPGMVRDGRILSAPALRVPGRPSGRAGPEAGQRLGPLRPRIGAVPGHRQAHQGGERRRPPGRGRGDRQGLRGRSHPRDRRRDGVLPGWTAAAPLRVLAHAISQGPHLQRGAGRRRPAGDRHQEVAAAGPGGHRDLPSAALLRPLLHRRRELRPSRC